MKVVEERVEGVLQWFGNVERIENGRISKRVQIGDNAGSCSVDRLRKRWSDSLKDCLGKRFGYQTSRENSAW